VLVTSAGIARFAATGVAHGLCWECEERELRPRVPVTVIDERGTRPGTLTSDEHGDVIEVDE
jgi:hypothetical protein